MTRMNPILRERWAAALESDEYRQGHGALSRVRADGTREYCCLGVLTALAVEDGVVVRHDGATDGDGRELYGARPTSSYLPDEVVAWADLPRPNPEVKAQDDAAWRTSLAALNDAGTEFRQIAALIRRYL